MDTIKHTSNFTTSYDISGSQLPMKKTTPFWSQDPNIIFDKEQIFQFFPTDSMDYNAKLNAISRTIIILTVFTFAFTRSLRILVVGAITLFAIYLLFYYKTKDSARTNSKKMENFTDAGLSIINDLSRPSDLVNTFDTPNPSNPFTNVMLPDYDFNPNKKPAPPSYNVDVNANILDSAKEMVKLSNPGQPDISDKLFKDLGEQLEFEQSMRQFYSNPGTTIPNDQTAFAEFCYGSMISCKEGNLFACARNLDRYQN
jgi:Ca2+/Na+ antiporter